MPNVEPKNLDYSAMAKAAQLDALPPEMCQHVYEALMSFLHLCWGVPPTSESVRTSLEGIRDAANDAAVALNGLFTAYSAAHSAALVLLCGATHEPPEDYLSFHRQSMKLRMIAGCAENAICNVPTLPRGNPGKQEFRALILALHAANSRSGWYTEKSDYDEASDSDMTVYSGRFVAFVCEAMRQLKPFLRAAPVNCWPKNLDLGTDSITPAETNAVGRAIKAIRQTDEATPTIPRDVRPNRE